MHRAVVALEGHIIDSLALPRVWDMIMDLGGNFDVEEFRVGKRKNEQSFVRLSVEAPDEALLEEILTAIQQFGATPIDEVEADLEAVTQEGVFPQAFYSTSNQPTSVRHGGKWREVENIEMDCGIAVADGRAFCLPVDEARVGQDIVVGYQGIRVRPLERARDRELFGFMQSQVSAEKPKKLIIGEIAKAIRQIRADGGSVLFVGGPAVIHTGAGRYLSALIRGGFVQVLFAGNALAAHDIESSLYGTSLGISLESGLGMEHGHEHHIRAINEIRRAGSIAAAVESGVLSEGVMYEAVKAGVKCVLAGSIRDDGPLPDVITDVIVAQKQMRQVIHETDIRLALMVGTMLHSIATGNLLPATVRTVCVDMEPSVVTKLADRGSFQTIGIVTDVESFLRELALDLGAT
ncbi:MAG TPA: TIGR00300 family protein [Candidatus Dormibacteraeota bacterium]|jgi:lysine-ketoglutarate reductase/saccharopine dehydrogenase-like protein (TIGR00300 family)|nr:TIGR00300 family protein [Candidatus Dormibacteraeota bacterium]